MLHNLVPVDKVLIVNVTVFLFNAIFLSYLAGKLPESIYDGNNWLFRERSWERGGQIYDDILKVRLWKSKLPEVSDFIKSTFPKKRIIAFTREYLNLYLLESCRSELAHWNIIISSVFFSLWNNIFGVMVVSAINIVLNLPYIIIQRYNRPRIKKLIYNKYSKKRYAAELLRV